MRSSLILLFVMLAVSPCWAAESLEPVKAPGIERFYPDRVPADAVPDHTCQALFPFLGKLAELVEWLIFAVKVITFSVFGLGFLNVLLNILILRRSRRMEDRLSQFTIAPREKS